MLPGNKSDLIAVFQSLGVRFNENNSGDWVRGVHENNVIRLDAMNPKGDVVPDVRGMSAKDAVQLIERTGMSAFVKGHGKVTEQSIKPGTDAVYGRLIQLTLTP